MKLQGFVFIFLLGVVKGSFWESIGWKSAPLPPLNTPASIPQFPDYQKLDPPVSNKPQLIQLNGPIKAGQMLHIVGEFSENDTHLLHLDFLANSTFTPFALFTKPHSFSENPNVSSKILASIFAVNFPNGTILNDTVPSPLQDSKAFDFRVRFLEKHVQIFANLGEIGLYQRQDFFDTIKTIKLSGSIRNLSIFRLEGSKYPNPFTRQISFGNSSRLDISAQPIPEILDESRLKAFLAPEKWINLEKRPTPAPTRWEDKFTLPPFNIDEYMEQNKELFERIQKMKAENPETTPYYLGLIREKRRSSSRSSSRGSSSSRSRSSSSSSSSRSRSSGWGGSSRGSSSSSSSSWWRSSSSSHSSYRPSSYRSTYWGSSSSSGSGGGWFNFGGSSSGQSAIYHQPPWFGRVNRNVYLYDTTKGMVARRMFAQKRLGSWKPFLAGAVAGHLYNSYTPSYSYRYLGQTYFHSTCNDCTYHCHNCCEYCDRPSVFYQHKRTTLSKPDPNQMPLSERLDLTFFDVNDSPKFQISVRFLEGVIVRNTFNKGKWEKEERDGEVPIDGWKIFDMTIMNSNDALTIYFGGKKFTDFRHREATRLLQKVKIEGDLEIHRVILDEKMIEPESKS